MTLHFVPAGLAIHLFQTRKWPNALTALALPVGGIMAAAYLAGAGAYMLLSRNSLELFRNNVTLL